MKIQEILEDSWDDEDEGYDLPNPLPVATGQIMDRVWEFADKIDDRIITQYKKTNNIDNIGGVQIGKILVTGRKEVGTMGNVPVNRLVGTEKNLDTAHFNDLVANRNPQASSEDIVVLKIGDKYYIQDGNHRAAAAAQQGVKEVPALILDVKALLK